MFKKTRSFPLEKSDDRINAIRKPAKHINIVYLQRVDASVHESQRRGVHGVKNDKEVGKSSSFAHRTLSPPEGNIFLFPHFSELFRMTVGVWSQDATRMFWRLTHDLADVKVTDEERG